MNKKTTKKAGKKVRRRILRRGSRKPAQKVDKTKLAFQEIRKDIKRLKKSKKKMQVLWYRTKKEHVALIKDLDKRIKEYVDLFEGKIDEVSFSDLPPPHPYCPKCRRTAAKFASMTEDELDAKLAA